MDTARWRQIERLFLEALEIEPERRGEWLKHACGADESLRSEVESLLASDEEREQGFLENRVAGAAAAIVAEPKLTRRVGPYELVRELGRGGMGTVYLARRADDQYNTDVAIKLVRPGFDTDFLFLRFKRERQILATFQHANIARLLDGGATDEGMPYIVMEYINGPRVTEYCRQQNLGLEAKLDLFRDICAAVEYAHRRFVVHRDIKPGNILVDESGTPKLLDFGICKLLYSNFEDGEATQTGVAAPLTPDYASPEQVRGEPVTIASDIYSLGAVLYEMLTGVRPHRIQHYTPIGVEKAICQEDTLLPSQVVRDSAMRKRLAGDLDNILMRAMHKDPQRRYGTAAELAADVRRYLADKPVLARADSRLYRFRKFVKRHRAGVAAAAVTVVVLTSAVVMALRDARLERERAQETRRLANTLLFDVHDALRDVPGATRARHVLVKSALSYLDNVARQTRNDPQLMADLARAYRRLADVQGGVMASNLGDTTGALDSYRRALALLMSAGKVKGLPLDVALEQARLRKSIGDLLSYTRSTAEALEQFRIARNEAEVLLARTPEAERAPVKRLLAESSLGAARVQRLKDDNTGSLENAQVALQYFEQLHKQNPGDMDLASQLSSALSATGMAEHRLARPDVAIRHFRRAVTLLDEVSAANLGSVSVRRQLMLAWSHVGDATSPRYENYINDPDTGRDAYEKVAAIARDLHVNDPADQRARSDYGIALMRLASATPDGDPATALTRFHESHKLLAEAAQADPRNRNNRVNLAFVELRIGELLLKTGRSDEAPAWWKHAATNSEQILDSGQYTPARTLQDACRRLGEDAARRNRRGEAEAWLDKALRQGETMAATPKAPLNSLALRPRGYAAAASVHRILGDIAEARTLLLKADGEWKKLSMMSGFGQNHRTDWKEVQEALQGVAR